MQGTISKPRRRAAAFAGVLITALSAPSPAGATDLTVVITNMRSADGNVHVSVYDNPETFPKSDGMLKELIVKAGAPTLEVVFPGLAPGTYAAAAFHDENGDGKFDKGFLGLPQEDYAFSNDAPVFLSAPGFDAAAFAVAGDVARISMPMKR